jgi:hypothetical protein
VVSILLACNWFGFTMERIDWTLFCVFASALAASSILFFQEEIFIETNGISIEGRVCQILASYSCARIRFGQYLGYVTASISLLMVCFHPKIPSVIHLLSGVLLFAAWSCAAAYITFGTGHGRNAGSVYLEVWAGFFLSLDITTSNIVELIRQKYEWVVEEEQSPTFVEGINLERPERPVTRDAKGQPALSQDQETVCLPESEDAVIGNNLM